MSRVSLRNYKNYITFGYGYRYVTNYRLRATNTFPACTKNCLLPSPCPEHKVHPHIYPRYISVYILYRFMKYIRHYLRVVCMRTGIISMYLYATSICRLSILFLVSVWNSLIICMAMIYVYIQCIVCSCAVICFVFVFVSALPCFMYENGVGVTVTLLPLPPSGSAYSSKFSKCAAYSSAVLNSRLSLSS